MDRLTIRRGVAVAATLAIVATVAVAARYEAAPTLPVDAEAEALVNGWIEAIGPEIYGKLQSARYSLVTEMYEPETGRLRRARPRYVTLLRHPAGELTRIERWEGNDFIVQAWDGVTPRATVNGEPVLEGHMDYDQVQYVSGDVNYWISLPYKLHDAGVNLHYRGTDETGWHVVGVTFGDGIGLHDGDDWQYWFEDGKTWPVQVAYREEGRSNYSKLRFEDVTTVDGYVFVGSRVHINADGNVWKILRVRDFELNPDLDEAIFSNPVE